MKVKRPFRLSRCAYKKSDTLDLSGKQLATLPHELCTAVKQGKLVGTVKNLSLQKNAIRDIEEINELSPLNLLVLNLFSNNLERLPAKLGFLSTLTKLYLDSNQLKAIPKEIGLLKELTWLSMENNLLTELPNELSSCSKLKTLCLNSNRFASFPPTPLPSSIAILSLSHNPLSTFPPALLSLPCLTSLSLILPSLNSIPAIPTLTALTINTSIPLIIPPSLFAGLTGKALGEKLIGYLAWCKALNLNIDIKGHWVKDNDAVQCSGCGEGFSTFNRRHHCRLCGYLFCKNCISPSQHPPPPYLPPTPKLCSPCSTSTVSFAARRKGTVLKEGAKPGGAEKDRVREELNNVEGEIKGAEHVRNNLVKLQNLYKGDTSAKGIESLNQAKAQEKAMNENLEELNKKKRVLQKRLDTLEGKGGIKINSRPASPAVSRNQSPCHSPVGSPRRHHPGSNPGSNPSSNPNSNPNSAPGSPSPQRALLRKASADKGEEEKKGRVKVLFDFEAQNEGELGLQAGEEIVVLEKMEGDWWLGEKPDGTSGYFPFNYVSVHV
eukprot:TRINITY_DN6274_c0_g1_i3.p1 TRINITY_DN6274_c0_g1~~TRINITY_DN6274_c0_g1_i3.p1  ORF type:complete len:550 (-),score=151.95 TRINITY_DN6274_c0_g1_i3:59-1708(-)